ncbi:hypothetical protein [Fodinibius salinus]|uniref:hypothetical protein n=1 Tax=Fodinibius salinus TaxID=860790 RepID=UPI0011E84CB2|nr:hypothetical protein [Fodinibius salinus]
MNKRRKYIKQIVVVFTLSLLGTLLLMTPAKASTNKTIKTTDVTTAVQTGDHYIQRYRSTGF